MKEKQLQIIKIFNGAFRKYIDNLIIDERSSEETHFIVFDLKIESHTGRYRLYYENVLVMDIHQNTDKKGILHELVMFLFDKYNEQQDAARAGAKEKLIKKFGNLAKE